MAADSSSSPPPPQLFGIGDHVEVTSAVHKLRGSLFPATIVEASADGTKFTVEYNKVKTELYREVTGHTSVRDEVHVSMIGWVPPREEGFTAFKVGDCVDAFLAGGWWEGVVVGELEDVKFEVFFQLVKQRFEFEAEEMRIHRDWVRGAWLPPLGDQGRDKKKVQKKVEMGIGTEVEISSNEDGFEGSWFGGSVVKVLGKDRFLVQYKTLMKDDGKELLTEEVDADQLRPCPPETNVVDAYSLNDRVDAFWNDGWWEGKVCKVLHGGRYKIYFEATHDKLDFDHTDLRPRQVWMNGIWV